MELYMLRISNWYFGLTIIISLNYLGTATLEFPDGVHPMLYYARTDVDTLIKQADYSHAKIASNIYEAGKALTNDQWKYLPPKDYKSFAAGWNEHYGNNLCAFSFYCVINPDDEKALDLVKVYMDRLAGYRDWYVTGSHGADIGPIAHTVTGFATAYDFLYEKLDLQRRQIFYDKIKTVTSDLYNMFEEGKFDFVHQYTHSQVASNIVGILLGALVVSAHEPELAAPWLQKTKDCLEFSMELLSFVVDGSTSEGVSYGSYTSRGLTQYAFLAKRHFSIDHGDNPWLREHFWFYYHTILPGFQRTVGIADSNHNWLYGPESQILYLDSQIMRTGYGNWLRERIQEARVNYKPIAPSPTQVWSTHHTEYIFYDSSLESRKPQNDTRPPLRIFSDWGVITYGGGQYMDTGNTFLSFKSGVPGGEAAQAIMHSSMFSKRIRGWDNFKPGHEHPDQNSFVFVPNGRCVVSEALHGPKFSFLDNTLVFGPSPTSKCNQPWEGQIGECTKWLQYDQYTSDNVRGEILTATTADGMVFVAGEAAGMYSKSLGLSSVFRSLLLLNPEVLIIVDSVRIDDFSPLKKASAFFHNIWKKFEPYEHQGFSGTKVQYPEGAYSFFTVARKGQKLDRSIHNGVKTSGLREGPTNYVNLTFELKTESTEIVHIFHGPTYKVENVQLRENCTSGVSFEMVVNGEVYKIDISTTPNAFQRYLYPNKERHNITGYSGFARVHHENKTHYFGLRNPVALRSDPGIFERNYRDRTKLTRQALKILPRRATFTSSFDEKYGALKSVSNTMAVTSSLTDTQIVINTTKTEPTSTANSTTTSTEDPLLSGAVDEEAWKLSLCALVIVIAISCACKVYHASKRDGARRNTRNWQYLSRVFGCLLIFMVLINCICLDGNGNNVCIRKNRKETKVLPIKPENQSRVSSEESTIFPSHPFIFVTSLPGSGGDLLKNLFERSDLLTYIPASEVEIPAFRGNSKDTHPCIWEQSVKHTATALWFGSLIEHPFLHFNQERGNQLFKRRLRENPNTPLVFHDDTGFWTTKLPWIRRVTGEGSFQPILVVRDPRSWIHMLLSNSHGDGYEKTTNELAEILEKVSTICTHEGVSLPFYYQHFKETQSTQWRAPDDIEKLAVLWTITTGTAMANVARDTNSQWPMHVVRFEDILSDPEATATDMFSKLGFPLTVKSLNQLSRVVKSRHYRVPYDGIVSPEISEAWKNGLAKYDIEKIEEICGGLMRIFKYKCYTGACW